MARPGSFTFRPHGAGLEKFFGSLESVILELIWLNDECSARQIYEALRDRGRRISYGAAKTVLDRLVRKQILQRVAEGRHFLYTAQVDRATLLHKLVATLIESLREEADSDIVSALSRELHSQGAAGSST